MRVGLEALVELDGGPVLDLHSLSLVCSARTLQTLLLEVRLWLADELRAGILWEKAGGWRYPE